ncbi:MAG: hypothetical protein ACE5G9_05310 [Nitrospinales bacterium]
MCKSRTCTVLLALWLPACAGLDANLEKTYAAGYSPEKCIAKANALIKKKELVFTSEDVYLGHYGPPRRMYKKRAEAERRCRQAGQNKQPRKPSS